MPVRGQLAGAGPDDGVRIDFAGAVRALQFVVERRLTLRPVRRLDVHEWDGRPVRETDAFAPLVAAGFSVDGERLSNRAFMRPMLSAGSWHVVAQ